MASQHRIVLTVMTAYLAIAPMSCDWARDAAGTVTEIENRYPGSRVEIDDRKERGARNIAVTINDADFDAGEEVNLAEHAREVADLVRRRYDLAAGSDTVAVAFRSESRAVPVATRQNARFVYPVSEIAPD